MSAQPTQKTRPKLLGELPIYKDTLTLYGTTNAVYLSMPKRWKLTFGVRFLSACDALIGSIFDSHRSVNFEKVQNIEDLGRLVFQFGTYVKIAQDSGPITSSQYSNLIKQLGNISAQVGKWKKYAQDKCEASVA